MKNLKKKGFTIVELVIVIAVIAILSAVLIPTFSSLIKKANINADSQLCRNMNSAIAIAKAEGKTFEDMEDVLIAINEAGYVIENLNPTTEGYYFIWDTEKDQIIFIEDDLTTPCFPENAEFNPTKCWITAENDAEADKLAGKGYGLYLEPQFEGPLSLTKIVNVDAGVNVDVDLDVTSDEESNYLLRGNFDTVNLNTTNSDAVQFGTIKELNVLAMKASTLEIYGFVKKLSVQSGGVELKEGSVVYNLTGTIKENSKGLIIENKPNGYENPNVFTINSKTELQQFRDIVNAGYDYEGITVKLNADIDLQGLAWLPIGNVYRGNANVSGAISGFAGTFDGQNHTIKNLSNNGFSVDGLASGRNSTSVANSNEVVFGLFGCVENATIKNLTVSGNVTDEGSEYLGDANGFIVGYAYGNTFVIENCIASGSISGSDNIGGLVGYINVKTVTIKNCINNANVNAYASVSGKAGGIAGSITIKTDSSNGYPHVAGITLTFEQCSNNGKITGKINGDLFTIPNSFGTINGTKVVITKNHSVYNGNSNSGIDTLDQVING